MKINNKGFTEVAILISVIFGLVAFFVPNPLSSGLGVGVRPNKTVLKDSYKETVELIKDKEGNLIGQKTIAQSGLSDVDQQQKVSLLEQIRHLPLLLIILIGLGAGSPIGLSFIAFFKKKFNDLTEHHRELEDEVKTVIRAVDEAFNTIPMTIAGAPLPPEVDRVALAKKVADGMYAALSTKMDKSTKELVRELRAA